MLHFSLFGRKRSTTAWGLQKVNMKPIDGQLSANIVTARWDKLETRPGEKLKTATCGQHRKGISRHGFNIGPTQGRVTLRGVGYRCCIMACSNIGCGVGTIHWISLLTWSMLWLFAWSKDSNPSRNCGFFWHVLWLQELFILYAFGTLVRLLCCHCGKVAA